MKRAVLLLVLLLPRSLVLADDAVARNADAWCATQPGEILVRDTAKVWHRVADERPRTDEEGRLVEAWTGDLDGDGRGDLVLRRVAGCGSRECMFEAFVACADGTYSAVMAPTYGDKVRVVRERPRSWRRIETRSVGDSKVPSERYAWIAQRFETAGYR